MRGEQRLLMRIRTFLPLGRCRTPFWNCITSAVGLRVLLYMSGVLSLGLISDASWVAREDRASDGRPATKLAQRGAVLKKPFCVSNAGLAFGAV